jgi:signal transduction histidine kinase
VDLRFTLTRIVDEMRAAFPGHVLSLNCPPLPGRWDRDRLEQVFSNLIGNAILHGAPDAPVTIVAAMNAHEVQVSVHNHGPAIPPEIQTTLFNPFRRGERESRTAKTAGLGLGLYISHEIVRGHGGVIDIQSNAAEGTTFRVSLPIHATDSP